MPSQIKLTENSLKAAKIGLYASVPAGILASCFTGDSLFFFLGLTGSALSWYEKEHLLEKNLFLTPGEAKYCGLNTKIRNMTICSDDMPYYKVKVSEIME